VNAGSGNAPFQHRAVGVHVIVAGADIPSDAALAAEIRAEFPPFRRFLYLVGRRHGMLGHHIIINQYAVVSTRRHPIDQPIRFDRGFSGVALPSDDQPLILAPLGRLRLRLGIEDVRKPRLELLIVF